MPNPLTRNEDGEPNEELVLHHLKRRRVAMAHEIANQTTIIADRACPLPVGNTSCLDNGSIISHVVDQGNESVSEDGVSDPDFPVRLRNRRPLHWSGIIRHVSGQGRRKIKGTSEVAKQLGKT